MYAFQGSFQAAEMAASTGGGIDVSALAVAVMVAVSLMTLSYVGKALGPLMQLIKSIMVAMVTIGAGAVLVVYGLFYL